MPIRSFLDLDVYQRAYKAAVIVHKEIIPKLPDNEKYDLKSQLSRACKAIPAIIAEGYARKHHRKDWQKYIDNAIGEANEMIVHLSLAKDLYPRLVDSKLCDELIETYNIIGKQLFRLGKSWNSAPSSSHPDSRLTSHILTPLALTVPGASPITAPGNVPNVGISPILQTVITLLFVFAIFLSLFFLIYGGINFITSGGDKQKVAAARLRLTYAVVGLIIVLLSFFIVNVIGAIFGIQLLSVPGSSPVCVGANCILP